MNVTAVPRPIIRIDLEYEEAVAFKEMMTKLSSTHVYCECNHKGVRLVDLMLPILQGISKLT